MCLMLRLVAVVMVMITWPGVTLSSWQRRLDELTVPCRGRSGYKILHNALHSAYVMLCDHPPPDIISRKIVFSYFPIYGSVSVVFCAYFCQIMFTYFRIIIHYNHIVNTLSFRIFCPVNVRKKLRNHQHVTCNVTVLSSRCFKHSTAITWNDLPYDIRACDSVNVFKRKLKTHLFNIAYPT